MSALARGAIMNTLGDVQYIRGYHDACGGIPWVHWVMFSTSGDIMSTLGDIMSTSGFSIEIEKIYQATSPNALWYPLWCTEHPPMYSWYSPRFTHGISLMYWTSANVHMVSPTFIMISPDVLNMSRCTYDIPPFAEHQLIYWTHIIQGENFMDEYIDTFETLLWYFCCYHGSHFRTRAVYLKTKKALLC